MGFKDHPPSSGLLIGYDPEDLLPGDHLARQVEKIVNAVPAPKAKSRLGQRAYSPQMLAKVLIYGYSTGVFSSRRLAQNCLEHLAYLYLTRGEAPCFKTLCSARIAHQEYLEQIWLSLRATAESEGFECLGRLAMDATRIKANASGDLVLSAAKYDQAISDFQSILARAQESDRQEDAEGEAVRVRTGVDAKKVTVRSVVRRVGKSAPEGEISPGVRKRLEDGVDVLERARSEKLSHVSLSDPDARMMPVGSRKALTMGHALEAVTDSGVLVHTSTTNAASDSGRLQPLVESAASGGSVPVVSVVADSGYFEADQIVALQDAGIEVVVPDSTTAGHMRGRQRPSEDRVLFEKIEGRNAYECPAGNVLSYVGRVKGRKTLQYRAVRECVGCPLADRCLSKPGTKHRTISVRPQEARMKPYMASFDEPEMRAKYYARGPAIETVFAFIRTVLGFSRWSLRGSAKISAEATLLSCAYQLRKSHTRRMQKA